MLPANKLISALNVQKAISSAMGNSVTKQSVIRKAVTTISGFDSYEQALALTDRNALIKNSVWAERGFFSNEVLVHAGFLTFHFDCANGHVNVGGIDEDSLFASFDLPETLKGYAIVDDEMHYSHSKKSITLNLSAYVFTITRDSENSATIEAKSLIKENYFLDKRFCFSGSDFNKLEGLLNKDLRLAELFYAMDLTESGDVEKEAKAIGISELDLENTIWTAIWLKNDKDPEIGITRVMTKTLGVVCDLYINKYLSNRYIDSDANIDFVLNKLNISPFDFNLLRNMARNEAQRFKFSHFIK